MSVTDELAPQHEQTVSAGLGHQDPGGGSAIDLTQPRGSSRPTFTITDAATACAVSRKTITRKLSDLAAHGASKDDDGIWRIPVEALLAVGLHPGRSLPRDSATTASAPPSPAPPMMSAPPVAARPAPGPDMVSVTRERWDDLRLRLARAEAEASERAAALADARLALRALTAAAPVRPEQSVPQPRASVPTAAAATRPRKRRWWQAKEAS